MSQGESSVRSRQKCREIMTKNVRTATREASLREVAAMMREGDMGAVPIVDGEKLVGIVTDRDMVVRAVAAGSGPDSPVSGAMTTELSTVKPDDFVFEAVRLMGDKQVRRIPVVNENGSLAGIIAMADVALEMLDRARQPLAHRLALGLRSIEIAGTRRTPHRQQAGLTDVDRSEGLGMTHRDLVAGDRQADAGQPGGIRT